MDQSINQFSELSWNDLILWAGKKTIQEGQSLQQKGQVKDLALSSASSVIAWVEDDENFSTKVEYHASELSSICSCHSTEHACAHAIAVIIECIAHLKGNISIPDAKKNDQRFFLL